ncbi:MAG: hypothetical protein WC494_04330 [Candidatus Pacearchaeota archaeon]
MRLEQQLYEAPRTSEPRQIIYDIGSLEGLSATALYTPKIGSSDFQVSLPMSNSVDKGLRISTPESTLIVNSYRRIIGQSGVDYFNPDGSIAGRLLGLNNSEVKYLKDLDK